MTRPLMTIALLAIALSGCSSQSAPAVAANVPSSAPTPAATTQAASALTARQALDKLITGGVAATNPKTQTENDDPNNLLGRPGEYTSRASADLVGGEPAAAGASVDRGIVVEAFPSPADAKRRSDYIQSVLKGSPALGTEWHYLSGAVLVRVTGKVKPSDAAKVEAAVKGL